ncbi:MAG: diphosphomevalonate decarboxylase [Anaerolineae bacterium]
MLDRKATAIAHPNIAFIKYWGNHDEALRLPANPSLSMNLGDLVTTTTLAFDEGLGGDEVVIDEQPAGESARARVSAHLDLVRQRAGLKAPARVVSRNNFPTGAGVASSASGFAALTVAACAAAGLDLSQAELSALARRGSGSASRSLPGGYTEWLMGRGNASSFARTVAPASHWDLRDLVVVVSREHKAVGSSRGHGLAVSSPLHQARLAAVPAMLAGCKRALLARDLSAMGVLIEQDAVMMHAVMMTSRPPLYYWTPETIAVIQAVQRWRAEGLPVYYTIDAGPNVHLICQARDAAAVEAQARALPGVLDILISGPGGPAHLVEAHLF